MLLAGFLFYGWWKWQYLGLLFFSTLLDFFIAKKIAETQNLKHRKLFLWCSVIGNLSVLIGFKYIGFFSLSIPDLANFIEAHPNLDGAITFLSEALPVGISFYTFQTMSYTIDVYRKKISPEKNIGYFALFVSYFPQLVAGPIERFSELQPQLKKHIALKYDDFQTGFRFLLWGFFIKMCIADNLGTWVDTIYLNPVRWHPTVIWFAIMGFAIQIYTDFHGYTLIAKGVARLFGVNLMDNFNKPYAAQTIDDFWKRWHISLTSWFRDYLYIPLGGNKLQNPAWIANILLVFLISGLWHGANYTFIAWGLLHGIFYLIEKKFQKNQTPKPHFAIMASVGVFFLVSIAWVFFRSTDFNTAFAMLNNAFFILPGKDFLEVQWVILILVVLFMIVDHLIIKTTLNDALKILSWPKRWVFYSLLIFALINYSGATAHPFIYFRF